jgi:E3 ubiquitin-protein ligase DOA10
MATQSPQSGSQMEVVNIIAEEEDRFCRICKDDDELEQLVHPCACNGSVRHVHNHCL